MNKIHFSGSGFLGWLDAAQLSKALIVLIIAFGTLTRLSQYLANRSLWLDEAMLALNIVHRSAADLLMPLEHDQAAPPFFLLFEKWATLLFGSSEYALRVFPLAAGIAGLLFFYPFAKQFVSSIAAIIALGFFAILDSLIYYSSEVKQYSSDVAITLFLFWLGTKAHLNGWRTGWLISFAFVSVVAFWLSYPAVFVVMGIELVCLFAHLRRKEYGTVGKLGVVLACSAASLIILYLTSLQNIRTNQTLLAVWQSAFMPFPPTSFSKARWVLDTFLEFFSNPLGLSLSGLGAFLCIFGGAEMFSSDRRKFFVLVAPVFLTLLASALHAYPFSDRLVLFLIPIVLLFIAEGIVHLKGSTPRISILTQAIVIGLLLFQPLISATKHILQPRTAEEIRPVLTYIKQHVGSQDVIYIYYSAQYAFQFYSRDDVVAYNYVIGKESRMVPENYAKDLDQLRGKARVWVLFSHVYNWQGIDEETLILNDLNLIGVLRDSFRSPGAVVYLYNLQN